MITPEELTDQIKELVLAELTALRLISSGMGIGEDGLKRLAQCSLILYRIRTPPEGPKKELTNEELMKGGTLNE